MLKFCSVINFYDGLFDMQACFVLVDKTMEIPQLFVEFSFKILIIFTAEGDVNAKLFVVDFFSHFSKIVIFIWKAHSRRVNWKNLAFWYHHHDEEISLLILELWNSRSTLLNQIK